LGYIGVSSTTITQCALKATKFGQITQSRGYYAIQGRSRSPSSYATSY